MWKMVEAKEQYEGFGALLFDFLLMRINYKENCYNILGILLSMTTLYFNSRYFCLIKNYLQA